MADVDKKIYRYNLKKVFKDYYLKKSNLKRAFVFVGLGSLISTLRSLIGSAGHHIKLAHAFIISFITFVFIALWLFLLSLYHNYGRVFLKKKSQSGQEQNKNITYLKQRRNADFSTYMKYLGFVVSLFAIISLVPVVVNSLFYGDINTDMGSHIFGAMVLTFIAFLAFWMYKRYKGKPSVLSSIWSDLIKQTKISTSPIILLKALECVLEKDLQHSDNKSMESSTFGSLLDKKYIVVQNTTEYPLSSGVTPLSAVTSNVL